MDGVVSVVVHSNLLGKLLLSLVTRISQVFCFISLLSREETLLLWWGLFASRESIEKLMKNSQIIGKLKINKQNYLRAFKLLKVFLFLSALHFSLERSESKHRMIVFVYLSFIETCAIATKRNDGGHYVEWHSICFHHGRFYSFLHLSQ